MIKAGTIAIIITFVLNHYANATSYFHDGKEITKGQAIKLLANDPKAEVIKQDLVKLDDEKGTLKVIKK